MRLINAPASGVDGLQQSMASGENMQGQGQQKVDDLQPLGSSGWSTVNDVHVPVNDVYAVPDSRKAMSDRQVAADG
jgi:hypothetical protein